MVETLTGGDIDATSIQVATTEAGSHSHYRRDRHHLSRRRRSG